jgi:hypothetical protein
MSKTFWFYTCVALDKVSGALGLLTFKARRVPIVRQVTAWLGVKVALLGLRACRKALSEEAFKVAAKEAHIEAARTLVQRLNEEALDALTSALDDPEHLEALAQQYHLPDMDLFIDALKDEMQKRQVG